MHSVNDTLTNTPPAKKPRDRLVINDLSNLSPRRGRGLRYGHKLLVHNIYVYDHDSSFFVVLLYNTAW